MKTFAARKPITRLGAARRGISLFGLLFWVVILGSIFLVGLKVFPTFTEYTTIKTMVNKAAADGGSTVQEIRASFERQQEVNFGITSIKASDLDITKENDKVVVRFAYNKEIELLDPVYLLIKYEGRSK